MIHVLLDALQLSENVGVAEPVPEAFDFPVRRPTVMDHRPPDAWDDTCLRHAFVSADAAHAQAGEKGVRSTVDSDVSADGFRHRLCSIIGAVFRSGFHLDFDDGPRIGLIAVDDRTAGDGIGDRSHCRGNHLCALLHHGDHGRRAHAQTGHPRCEYKGTSQAASVQPRVLSATSTSHRILALLGSME